MMMLNQTRAQLTQRQEALLKKINEFNVQRSDFLAEYNS
jgi:hypothetical protein